MLVHQVHDIVGALRLLFEIVLWHSPYGSLLPYPPDDYVLKFLFCVFSHNTLVPSTHKCLVRCNQIWYTPVICPNYE